MLAILIKFTLQKKKRRLIGPTFEKVVSLIINEGVSCEMFREREAVRLMKEGI